jgi:hypothetical protein
MNIYERFHVWRWLGGEYIVSIVIWMAMVTLVAVVTSGNVVTFVTMATKGNPQQPRKV